MEAGDARVCRVVLGEVFFVKGKGSARKRGGAEEVVLKVEQGLVEALVRVNRWSPFSGQRQCLPQRHRFEEHQRSECDGCRARDTSRAVDEDTALRFLGFGYEIEGLVKVLRDVVLRVVEYLNPSALDVELSVHEVANLGDLLSDVEDVGDAVGLEPFRVTRRFRAANKQVTEELRGRTRDDSVVVFGIAKELHHLCFDLKFLSEALSFGSHALSPVVKKVVPCRKRLAFVLLVVMMVVVMTVRLRLLLLSRRRLFKLTWCNVCIIGSSTTGKEGLLGGCDDENEVFKVEPSFFFAFMLLFV